MHLLSVVYRKVIHIEPCAHEHARRATRVSSRSRSRCPPSSQKPDLGQAGAGGGPGGQLAEAAGGAAILSISLSQTTFGLPIFLAICPIRTNQSINQPTKQSISQPASQPSTHKVSQSVSQSINQSLSQSVSQSVKSISQVKSNQIYFISIQINSSHSFIHSIHSFIQCACTSMHVRVCRCTCKCQ